MASSDIKRVLRDFRSLGEKAMQRASARALNRTGVSVRAEASRQVRESLALKAGDVKDVIKVERTKGTIDVKRQRIELTILQKGISLFKYGAKAKRVRTDKGPRTGVTVKVKRQGTRKLVTGGFIATLGSGKVAIFKRRGDDRLPIKLQYGPSVRDFFRGRDQVGALLKYARATLAKTLRRELNYELQKRK